MFAHAARYRFEPAVLAVIVCVLVLATAVAAQGTGPQQATSGPLPPAVVGPKAGTRLLTEGLTKTILGVPGYRWRHGCGPTAVGMIVGYYDSHGFPGLVPGGTSAQTSAVDQAIASQGSGLRGFGLQRHYEDYSLPKDSSGTIQKDSSETYPHNCHPDDSIGDYMQTSWSARNNRYGWSWSSGIIPGFRGYAWQRNPRYLIRARQFYMGSSLTWQVLKNEIDQDRPMCFLVDTNGDGRTDHFVTVVGYNESASGNQYGCLDTWSPASAVRWCGFQRMSTSYRWGVWGGWAFEIARPPVGGIAERLSVGANRREADAASSNPALSGDGRFVAFVSSARNLVPSDTNGRDDVFVRDRRTGATTRVSVSSGGGQANGDSVAPAVSADGRWVAFWSDATNLVLGDTNGCGDVFLHDRTTGITKRVSVSSAGREGNGACDPYVALSADGRHVAFASGADNLVAGDLNQRKDVFQHDALKGTTALASVGSTLGQANHDSEHPALSGDGQVVVFASAASNLVTGDTNGFADIFLRERGHVKTTRISVDSAGAQANGTSSRPVVSADGRWIAFTSFATNLVGGDTNGIEDVFLHDRQTGRTVRVSVASDTTEANGPSLDRPVISAAGDQVAFTSHASNLVPGDRNSVSDVFVHDVKHRLTERVSLDSAGRPGSRSSSSPAISGDARLVAFASDARDLVHGDTNGCADVFAHGTTLAPTLGSLRTPLPGGTVQLSLRAPDHAGHPYVLGTAFGFAPGIPVDTRNVPLTWDLLLGTSWAAPQIFQRYAGTLGGSGEATAYIHLPAVSQLVGHRFYTAFVTLDSTAPSGIRGISNALGLVIVP